MKLPWNKMEWGQTPGFRNYPNPGDSEIEPHVRTEKKEAASCQEAASAHVFYLTN